ncbi:hypothetical protein AB0C48_00445 [Streptomyces sp. NPDC048556]|uniref:hypothetical protein n=1 Tax=Streptomyces sp. NPDC048556 TaxID=3156664 RepID=UPI003447BE48
MNTTRINELIKSLQVADRQNRSRGAEGMERRKSEAVQILRELASLAPLTFRRRLMLAELELSRALAFKKSA